MGTHEYMQSMSTGRLLPTSGNSSRSVALNEGYAAIRSHPAHFIFRTKRLGGFDLQIPWGLPAGCVIASHCVRPASARTVHYERTSEMNMSLHSTFSWIAYAHAPGNLAAIEHA